MTNNMEYTKEDIVKRMRAISGNIYSVYTDWVRMCAIAIHNSVNFDSDMEKDYLTKAYPHKFRRTGATLALKRGMPLITVSKTLGHESIETTQIYLDISEDNLKNEHMKYC